jgi:hypothetical protein
LYFVVYHTPAKTNESSHSNLCVVLEAMQTWVTHMPRQSRGVRLQLALEEGSRVDPVTYAMNVKEGHDKVA